MPDQFGFASSISLRNLIEKHKSGKPVGIYSICSTNRMVLQAAMRLHRESGTMLLIESTCNQVNQDGGYSGMTPRKYTRYIKDLACEIGFPLKKIILGGDHLGPNPWKNESTEAAMRKAEKLVYDYVAAGYTKIHLDASMPCGDDDLLSSEEIAERSARLALQAEKASQSYPPKYKPLYVIGTEVPAPGGLTSAQDHTVHVSAVKDVEETIAIHCKVLTQSGLEKILGRIIAVVVSPGVEFGNIEIFPYIRSQTQALRKFIEDEQGLVFEAHSTDYQPPRLLRQMVEDHFAILKVGPALTFAFREAIQRLAAIEEEMPAIGQEERSNLLSVILSAMRENPKYWRDHYTGSENQIEYSLKFSYSDRIRYYWGFPAVKTALNKLLRNLGGNKIPMALISQYFPSLHPMIIEKQIEPNPAALIIASITCVLEEYRTACGS